MLATMAPALAKSRAARAGSMGLSEILAASQEFGIDRANLVERFAQFAEVGEELGGLQVATLGT